jgi:hypothetical protein
MNERIRKLAEQANDAFCERMGEGADRGTFYFNGFAEEFAMLIVTACAQQAYRYTDSLENARYYKEVGLDCLPGDLERHIKKHFGVEE